MIIEKLLEQIKAIQQDEYILPKEEPVGPGEIVLGEMTPEMMQLHTAWKKAEEKRKGLEEKGHSPRNADTRSEYDVALYEEYVFDNLLWWAVRESFPEAKGKGLAVCAIKGKAMAIALPYFWDPRWYSYD